MVLKSHASNHSIILISENDIKAQQKIDKSPQTSNDDNGYLKRQDMDGKAPEKNTPIIFTIIAVALSGAVAYLSLQSLHNQQTLNTLQQDLPRLKQNYELLQQNTQNNTQKIAQNQNGKSIQSLKQLTLINAIYIACHNANLNQIYHPHITAQWLKTAEKLSSKLTNNHSINTQIQSMLSTYQTTMSDHADKRRQALTHLEQAINHDISNPSSKQTNTQKAPVTITWSLIHWKTTLKTIQQWALYHLKKAFVIHNMPQKTTYPITIRDPLQTQGYLILQLRTLQWAINSQNPKLYNATLQQISRYTQPYPAMVHATQILKKYPPLPRQLNFFAIFKQLNQIEDAIMPQYISSTP